MKSIRALKAAGLILAAVVLGLMTVQGTYALWNDAVPSSAGTVQAANFSILVGTDLTGNVEMGSTPIAFSAGELVRGKAAYKAVDITNNVNVAPSSKLLVQPGITGLGPVAGFDGYLTVKAAAVTAQTNCSTVNPATYSPVPNIQPLAVGSTQRICLQLELSSTTPNTYIGKPIESVVSLTVAQVKPVLK